MNLRKNSKKRSLNLLIAGLSLLLLLVALTACEDREGDRPTLTLSVENDRLYGEGIDCNINYTNITFILDGSQSFISEAKILVEYDKNKGTFVGTGSTDFVITNRDGVAEGIYQAKPHAYGAVSFTAKIDRFRDVKETVTLYLYDIPEMELTADEYEISPDESTNIRVKLTDRADNVDNKTIIFTTNSGLLAFDRVVTDEDGIAYNVFDANEQTGPATIRAIQQLCPNRFEEITIRRVE